MISFRDSHILFCLLFLLLCGCQPKVYLMPPPAGIETGESFFELSGSAAQENLLHTLYATNRVPIGSADNRTGYSIFPSDKLEIGFLGYSVGYEGMSWDDLYRESLKMDRDDDLLLRKEFVRPMVEYDGNGMTSDPKEAELFFRMINAALEQSFTHDITVYVHGANSNFYRATAQGAQFFHFTGHNSVILSFAWPSAESLFRYTTDVRHAKKTVATFSRLLEILAFRTAARKINIIAYSAGAQVVAPGLAYLHEIYPRLSSMEIREKLRIGEVYFAAPDTAFKAFVEGYLKFKDIVERTTITLNRNDRVLLLAALQNGVSRLGRPDLSELGEKELLSILELLMTVDLDVIDVAASVALDIGGGHDYWYNNPWVSSDLLMLLLFKAGPRERGLVSAYNDAGTVLFLFPDDYAEKIPEIMEQLKQKMQERCGKEKGWK